MKFHQKMKVCRLNSELCKKYLRKNKLEMDRVRLDQLWNRRRLNLDRLLVLIVEVQAQKNRPAVVKQAEPVLN